jgi:MoxR-like ATPase
MANGMTPEMRTKLAEYSTLKNEAKAKFGQVPAGLRLRDLQIWIETGKLPARYTVNRPQVEVQNELSAELRASLKAEILSELSATVSGQKNTLEIKVNNLPVGRVEGRQHQMFAKVLRKALTHKQVLLVGPAGTGKTTIAAQVAAALSLEFASLSCTSGTSESHILGKVTADGLYLMSAFVRLYEGGGVFCLDEFDAADANVLLVINSAIANGSLPVPNRAEKPMAVRHENFILVCAANTFGTGASFQFTGRNQLDAATLDRFCLSTVFIGYDEVFEAELLADFPRFHANFKAARKAVEVNQIRKGVSLRLALGAIKELSAGVPQSEIWADFMVSWSATERDKVKAVLFF